MIEFIKGVFLTLAADETEADHFLYKKEGRLSECGRSRQACRFTYFVLQSGAVCTSAQKTAVVRVAAELYRTMLRFRCIMLRHLISPRHEPGKMPFADGNERQDPRRLRRALPVD